LLLAAAVVALILAAVWAVAVLGVYYKAHNRFQQE
jgi:hypothetical protein